MSLRIKLNHPIKAAVKAVVSLVAASVAVGGLVACQPPVETTTVAFKVPVTVAKVEKGTVEDLVRTTGTLRVAKVVTLPVETAGILQIAQGENGQIWREGERVKQGDVIANIIGEDIRLATRMELAKKKLDVARENLEASTKLFKDKLVSVERHGRDKTAFEEAKHEYERALQAQNRSKIVTPIDGVIIEIARNNGLFMANGQQVSAGQVIATIAPIHPLIADIDLVGKDIGVVKTGLAARTQYHGWEDKQFSGQVTKLAPTMDQQSRTLRAEVEVNNHERLLKPGMFVEVQVVTEKRQDVPVVARRSLTQRGGRTVVFVINGQLAEQREVQLGLGGDETVEILKGVEVGERVVVLGLQTLADQMPVTVTGS